jgi:hypothetical protein
MSASSSTPAPTVVAVVAVRAEAVDTTTTDAVPDLTSLPNLIKTWKTLSDETKDLKEQLREKNKRLKALEEMILQSMKRNNIGALDLRATGGRILYRRKTSKESLGGKNLQKLLGEHLKSEQRAADVMKFLEEKRGSKVKESLLYEHGDA